MNDEWMVGVDKRLQSLETFQAVEANHRQSVERRLGSIEDGVKWLLRLVVGSLVVGVITFALSGGFAV
jgi:hypothetical protein